MLEQLFGSQTRIKLLHHFLNNGNDKFFVRELTREIDSQINAVRRELSNLEDVGIITVVIEQEGKKLKKSAKTNNKQQKKYYQLNNKFVLYPELKSIFEKAHFLLEKKFAQSMQKIGKVHYLALTGSLVGNKEMPVDLILVGNLTKANKRKLERLIKNFEKSIRREINYSSFTKDEFDYRRSVADRFLYSILDAEKIVLIDEIFNSAQAVDDNIL